MWVYGKQLKIEKKCSLNNFSVAMDEDVAHILILLTIIMATITSNFKILCLSWVKLFARPFPPCVCEMFVPGKTYYLSPSPHSCVFEMCVWFAFTVFDKFWCRCNDARFPWRWSVINMPSQLSWAQAQEPFSLAQVISRDSRKSTNTPWAINIRANVNKIKSPERIV